MLSAPAHARSAQRPSMAPAVVRSAVSSSASLGVPLFYLLCLCLPLSFLLPAWLLKLMPATMLSAALLLVSLRPTLGTAPAWGFSAALLPLFAAGAVSVLANYDREDAYIGFAGGYFSAIIAYAAIRQCAPTCRQF